VTQDRVRVGTFLPTSASPDLLWEDPRQLTDAAQLAEGLGFDGLWMGDHYLTSPVHGESWHDPATLMAYLAAGTRTIDLGPAILVTPVRHPVWLAKQLASLQYLSRGRFSIAMATGFSRLEYAAVEVPIAQRGSRQDEIQSILRELGTGRHAAHEGRHFRFPELVIEPQPATPVPVYVAGGSQPDVNAEPGVAQAVIDRIARSDGWVTPTYAPPELIARDWARIRAAREVRDVGDSFLFAHMNFVHLVDTDDDELAFAEQRPEFMHHFGDGHRPWEVIEQGHFLGGITTIFKQIQQRLDIGCNYICLQPIARDPQGVQRQFRLIAERLMPQIREYVPQS
jgi:alkanesulfonate monooxygenase